MNYSCLALHLTWLKVAACTVYRTMFERLLLFSSPLLRFQTKALDWAKISSGEDGEDGPDDGKWNSLCMRYEAVNAWGRQHPEQSCGRTATGMTARVEFDLSTDNWQQWSISSSMWYLLLIICCWSIIWRVSRLSLLIALTLDLRNHYERFTASFLFFLLTPAPE